VLERRGHEHEDDQRDQQDVHERRTFMVVFGSKPKERRLLW